ncbi:MAG: TolC family protein [Bacteroidales bacterium]|nr:TolC family protein [Bacteroidales bacterium]
MRKGIIILMLAMVPLFIKSQESSVIRLSIDEAQSYAIENNKSLRNVRTDAEISKQQLWQAVSQGLPQVSATLDYTNFFNYEIEFGMGGGGSTPTIDFSVLDAGDLQILSFLQQSMGSGSTTITMKNSSSAKLQLTQLIFSGQYIAGIQMAKIGQILTDQNIEKSEIDIRESVISTYYLSLLTQESLDIIRANIANLGQTLIQTEAMLKAGMIEPTDVDQIKMSITMLENAERSLLRNVELNKNIMRFMLGIDNDTDIQLTNSFEEVISSVDLSNLIFDEFNPAQNISVQMMETQEVMTEKMLDLEKWSYAPTLVGVYNYNQKIITTDFDMNPRNLVSLNMSVPIFSSGMRKSKVEQKKLELYKIQNTKEIVTDQLVMQEKQLKFNLKSAMEQYESQKENVELAKRIFDNTELKFRQGVASSFDLIQANSSLLEAENNYLSACMEMLQAKLQYDKLYSKI